MHNPPHILNCTLTVVQTQKHWSPSACYLMNMVLPSNIKLSFLFCQFLLFGKYEMVNMNINAFIHRLLQKWLLWKLLIFQLLMAENHTMVVLACRVRMHANPVAGRPLMGENFVGLCLFIIPLGISLQPLKCRSSGRCGHRNTTSGGLRFFWVSGILMLVWKSLLVEK